MNKYQEALFKIRKSRVIKNSIGGLFSNYEILSIEEVLEEESNKLQELVDKVPYYKELEDKARPKKPNKLTYKLLLDEGWKYECPTCKCAIGINDNASDYMNEDSFCPTCSQAIDWSK